MREPPTDRLHAPYRRVEEDEREGEEGAAGLRRRSLNPQAPGTGPAGAE